MRDATRVVIPILVAMIAIDPARAQVPPEPWPEPTPELPAPPEPATPAPTPAAKGFALRQGDYTLTLVGRLQTYFLGTSIVTDHQRAESGLFELHRARLGVEGELGPRVLYKVQVELGKGNTHLKDFRFDVVLGRDVRLRMGQWKRPFSRQFLNSSFRFELVERAITDKAFGNSRDIGVAVGNDYEASPALEWTIGVYDGLDDEKPTVRGSTLSNLPLAFRPVLAARVGANRGAIKGYSEGDLDGGPLRYGAGAAVVLEGDVDRDGQAAHRFTIDAVAKLGGWSVSGAAFLATTGSGFADAWEATLAGGHVQLGHVIDHRVGLAARYATVLALGTSDALTQREAAVGLSYYLRGAATKLQVDLATRTVGEAAAVDHLRLQLQAQVSF